MVLSANSAGKVKRKQEFSLSFLGGLTIRQSGECPSSVISERSICSEQFFSDVLGLARLRGLPFDMSGRP